MNPAAEAGVPAGKPVVDLDFGSGPAVLKAPAPVDAETVAADETLAKLLGGSGAFDLLPLALPALALEARTTETRRPRRSSKKDGGKGS